MLFLMRGASCSGKDTFIEKYFEPHTVLSSDWYRRVLTNDITNQQQNGIVFGQIHNILEIRLKNRLPYTVINATHIKLKACSEPLELAEKFGELVTVISIDPPSIEELIERSNKRGLAGGLQVPQEVLERHWEGYYTSMPSFLERARKSPADSFTFIRIDQDHNLVNETEYELKARLYEMQVKKDRNKV